MRGIYSVSLLSAKGNPQAVFESILTQCSNPKPGSVAKALPRECIAAVCTSACSLQPLQHSEMGYAIIWPSAEDVCAGGYEVMEEWAAVGRSYKGKGRRASETVECRRARSPSRGSCEVSECVVHLHVQL